MQQLLWTRQFRTRGPMPALGLSVIWSFGCSGSSGGVVNPASGGMAIGNGGQSQSTGGSSSASGGTAGNGNGGATTLGGSVASTGGTVSNNGGNTTSNGGSSSSSGGTSSVGGATTTFTCNDGSSCPQPGATCKDATGASCNCVGPMGAAIVVCYGSGVGGATSGGSSGITGGATSNGGKGGNASGGVTTGGKATGGSGQGGTGASATGGTISTTGGSGAAGLPGVPCSGATPFTTASSVVQIAVDAAQKGTVWNRYYEKVVAADHANTILTTAWGRNIQGALKKGHDQAGFQSVRFHGILDSDVGVYTETGGVAAYNWTRLDQIYDAIIAAGMRPFVEISFMPPALASDATKTLHWYNGAAANISPPKDWTKWEALMTALVEHLESRYGVDEVRNNWYFEVWNEASWMYTLGMAGYNELYGHTARGLAAADAQIKVGGPAEAGGGSAWGISSLVSYAKANSLKLDFVSYHYYGQDSDTNLALANASIAFHGTMVSTVSTSKFAGQLFCTEWGPAYSTPAARDNEIGASFVAKVVHRIGTNPSVVAPAGYGYWTISDYIEEFNSGGATAFRNGNWGMLLKGDSRYPESFDIPKAPFNAFRLLHLMSDTNLSVSGGNATNGVNAAATIANDGSALQMLLYNHTDGGVADSSASSVVQVTINNLAFTATSLRARYYVLDRTRSNAYDDWVTMGKPSNPTQAQWITIRDAAELCYYDTTATLTNKSWTVSVPMNNYSVGLLVLSP